MSHAPALRISRRCSRGGARGAEGQKRRARPDRTLGEERAAELTPIHVREIDVHEEEVGLHPLDQVQGLPAGVCLEDGESGWAEDALQGTRGPLLVIDDDGQGRPLEVASGSVVHRGPVREATVHGQSRTSLHLDQAMGQASPKTLHDSCENRGTAPRLGPGGPRWLAACIPPLSDPTGPVDRTCVRREQLRRMRHTMKRTPFVPAFVTTLELTLLYRS
jgi:hypothetical protein